MGTFPIWDDGQCRSHVIIYNLTQTICAIKLITLEETIAPLSEEAFAAVL
jgi:hypothetical protein